jgi:peptidoglycan/LPS O-acetylase OafA/YrhL
VTRVNNFDAIRILAAVTVIFGHAHPLSQAPGTLLFGDSVQSIAVKIFFVISGFLVTKSWRSDPDLTRFFLRRGLRLFPGLALLLLLTVVVLGPLFTTLPLAEYFGSPSTYGYFWNNLVLRPVYALPGVFEANPYPSAVNGSLWSLPVEFFMYMLLPVIATVAAMMRFRGAFALLAIALAAAAFASLIYIPVESQLIIWGSGSRSLTDVGPYFLIGAVYAAKPIEAKLNSGWALFLVAVAALIQFNGYWTQQIVMMVVLPYVTLTLCLAATPGLSSAGRFGDPSYGIYLYGFPVQQAMFSIFGPQMSVWHNTLLSLPIVIALAYASWHLLEKRMLSHKPSKGLVALKPTEG